MAKHVVKVCRGGSQVRLTIPVLVTRSLKWEGVSYVIVEENKDGTLTIRRFVDGESLKGDSKRNRPGSD